MLSIQNQQKTCSFFGHREIIVTKELKQKLRDIIENLITKENFVIFFFGGFGEFDNLCHEIVTKLKNKYSFVKRIYVCEDYNFVDRPHKRPKWLTKKDYEEFIYLDMRYTGFYQKIYFRNIEMIEQSDFILFYVNNTENSNAYKTMQYAKRKKKTFINIA